MKIIKKKIKQGMKFVLEVDKKKVGKISIIKDKNPIKQHLADIKDFFVEKKYRKKGYGKLLVKECFKWAKKNRIKKVLISVRKGTDAQKVYKRLGFKKYGELKKGIKAPWEKKVYDEIFYEKEVK